MLIKDLKNEIKKYNKKELESIIVELYKRLPKVKKKIMILITSLKIWKQVKTS